MADDTTPEVRSEPSAPTVEPGRRGPRRWPVVVAGLLIVLGGACALFFRTAKRTSVEDGAIVLEAARRPRKEIRPKVTLQLHKRV